MNCIVNVSPDWGIGKDGQLLFSISADLRRFRTLTAGRVVILGRKTLETFPGGRPLRDRVNLVLSTDPALEIPGAQVAHDLGELRELCRPYPPGDLCVIGGASVYELLLPCCSRALVTKTLRKVEADRFFPDLDRLPGWRREAASEILRENGLDFQYVDYVNLSPRPL